LSFAVSINTPWQNKQPVRWTGSLYFASVAPSLFYSPGSLECICPCKAHLKFYRLLVPERLCCRVRQRQEFARPCASAVSLRVSNFKKYTHVCRYGGLRWQKTVKFAHNTFFSRRQIYGTSMQWYHILNSLQAPGMQMDIHVYVATRESVCMQLMKRR